jgi:hypothetical protein
MAQVGSAGAAGRWWRGRSDPEPAGGDPEPAGGDPEPASASARSRKRGRIRAASRRFTACIASALCRLVAGRAALVAERTIRLVAGRSTRLVAGRATLVTSRTTRLVVGRVIPRCLDRPRDWSHQRNRAAQAAGG